jgi:hypothetical protein
LQLIRQQVEIKISLAGNLLISQTDRHVRIARFIAATFHLEISQRVPDTFVSSILVR